MSSKVNIPVLTLSLALIAAIAAALLGGVYLLTEAPIAAALQEKTNVALHDVLPEFDNQPGEEIRKIGDVTFYIGRLDGKIIDVAGEIVTPKGYNGDITVLVGFLPDGSITTVLVTRQAETPGLGTVVCDRKCEKNLSGVLSGEKETGLPPNPILDQFSGMNAANKSESWAIKKDGGSLDAVSGATITTRAVVDAVHQVAFTFSENREKLLAGEVE